MAKNYNEYNFDSSVGFKSYLDIKGAVYPEMELSVKTPCKCFYHEHYNTNLPLVTALMEEESFIEGDIEFIDTVVLSGNYKPSAPIILNSSSLTVDLNNKKIIAPVFAESKGEVSEGNSDSYCFWVKDGGELTIDGNGEVIASEAEYSMAVWADGGKVTINGGKFYNNGNNSDLIYASKNAIVEIYGGEFHANENTGAAGTKNRYPALNIKDKDRATAKIVVYGGKFYGFDPANNVSEGANTNFVAPGYKSINIGNNTYQIVKE